MRALVKLFGGGSSSKRDKATPAHSNPSTSSAPTSSTRRQASEPAPHTAPPGLAPPPTLDVQLPARSPLRVPGADNASSSAPLDASVSSSTAAKTTMTTSGGSWVQIGRTGNELAKRPVDAMLDPQQALELLEACASVIQQRGLDILGIFRPHLDRADIGRLIELFVATLPDAVAAAESTTRIALPTELFGEAADPKLAFRQERRRSVDYVFQAHESQLLIENVHNVVALLRWGLRHLSYEDGFARSTWFTDWTTQDDSASHPRNSFDTLLAPSLPSASLALLRRTLELIAAVAARAEINGMSASRLCQILALALLGGQAEAYGDWRAVMAAWTEAADRLERVLLAYLRAQSDLPARLAELVVRYPLPVRVGADRSVEALVVGIELGGGGGKGGELSAADLLDLALSATASGEKEENVAWKRIVEAAGSRYKNVVEPDSGLVISTRSPSTLTTATTTTPRTVTPTRPRRSMSLDRPQLDQRGPAPSSTARTGLNAIAEQDRRSRSSSTATEPDWASFASSGFDSSAPVPILTLDAFPTAPRPAHTANKLVRRRSSASRRGHAKPIATSDNDVFASTKPSPRPAVAKVVDIKTERIDPAFAELYLDALGDKVATRTWPAFVLVELQKLEGVEAKLLLVERRRPSLAAAAAAEKTETLAAPDKEKDVVKPKIARSSSTASSVHPPSSPPRADRRGFMSFGRRASRRTSEIFTTSRREGAVKDTTLKPSPSTLSAKSQTAAAAAEVDEHGQIVQRADKGSSRGTAAIVAGGAAAIGVGAAAAVASTQSKGDSAQPIVVEPASEPEETPQQQQIAVEATAAPPPPVPTPVIEPPSTLIEPTPTTTEDPSSTPTDATAHAEEKEAVEVPSAEKEEVVEETAVARNEPDAVEEPIIAATDADTVSNGPTETGTVVGQEEEKSVETVPAADDSNAVEPLSGETLPETIDAPVQHIQPEQPTEPTEPTEPTPLLETEQPSAPIVDAAPVIPVDNRPTTPDAPIVPRSAAPSPESIRAPAIAEPLISLADAPTRIGGMAPIAKSVDDFAPGQLDRFFDDPPAPVESAATTTTLQPVAATPLAAAAIEMDEPSFEPANGHGSPRSLGLPEPAPDAAPITPTKGTRLSLASVDSGRTFGGGGDGEVGEDNEPPPMPTPKKAAPPPADVEILSPQILASPPDTPHTEFDDAQSRRSFETSRSAATFASAEDQS